jgi:hypothetical protein
MSHRRREGVLGKQHLCYLFGFVFKTFAYCKTGSLFTNLKKS